MTDTDLNVITAGESTDGNQQSDTVTTNIQDAPTTPSVEKGAGSLSTMVLPELRALANRAGVKGTSGMRKNELIAAIQETRGQRQANGASTTHAPSAQNHQESSESAPAPSSEARRPKGNRTIRLIQGPRGRAGNDAAHPAKRDRPHGPTTTHPPRRLRRMRTAGVANRTPRPTIADRTGAATRAGISKARAASRIVAARISKMTTATAVKAGGDAGSATAGAAVSAPAKAAAKPNCARTMSSSR